MYKLHDIQQVKPQQNYEHKSFFIRQKLPKSPSSIKEVQTKHLPLICPTPINTSKVGQQQKKHKTTNNYQVLSNKFAAF